jgi:hypothetical protein
MTERAPNPRDDRQCLPGIFERKHDETDHGPEHQAGHDLLAPLRICFRLRGGQCRVGFGEAGLQHRAHNRLGLKNRLIPRQQGVESRFDIA